ncbi:DgyrCDS12328 [Dimorphilus gyrociliatus]|uniref:DgyrCDS12328 n=1 Tax=Dimorphilus gyrociliatus TaxID=2664684 RepID=A0A7I8W6Y5_9ANNE|nr:DgyrCDS12328 [Dimorphilus gyrociliatus]
MIRTEENMTRNPFFFPWTNFPNLYSYNNYLKASDDCVSILLGSKKEPCLDSIPRQLCEKSLGRPTFGMKTLEAPTTPVVNSLQIAAGRPNRPRSEKKSVPEDLKDDKYFERRKRNNQAAKKSREARKAREDEIAIRASFLEKENAILRAQVATLREEANSLRQLLLQKRSQQVHHGTS